jgi:5,5'-dehydrodivanillate O-demethylase
MITAAENELLTRIGPGTRMGALLRRYWYPIAAAAEMDGPGHMRVRLLGEDLVLRRDRSGALGLTTQPGTDYYPVRELGGMVWAYLGPLPVPEIPRIDGFVVDGAIRLVGKAIVPCNWLQIMENSLDPVHAEWLHGHLAEFIREKDGVRVATSRRHERIRFKEFELGIYKQRLLAGQSEDADDWTVGHPVLFPTLLANGNASPAWRNYSYQIRVPMDDTNTLHFWYNAYIPPEGVAAPAHLLERTWHYDVPFRDERGEFTLQYTDSQDIMAWLTQGTIADRSIERLGTTDVGIIAYRQMLLRELKNVEDGRDPMGVIRDPSHATIELPLEKNKHHKSDGFEKTTRRSRASFSPVLEDLIAVFTQQPEREKVGSS